MAAALTLKDTSAKIAYTGNAPLPDRASFLFTHQNFNSRDQHVFFFFFFTAVSSVTRHPSRRHHSATQSSHRSPLLHLIISPLATPPSNHITTLLIQRSAMVPARTFFFRPPFVSVKPDPLYPIQVRYRCRCDTRCDIGAMQMRYRCDTDEISLINRRTIDSKKSPAVSRQPHAKPLKKKYLNSARVRLLEGVFSTTKER